MYENYYIIVVIGLNNKYDCLLEGGRIFCDYCEAEEIINLAKIEDKKENWNYIYKIEQVFIEKDKLAINVYN